MWTFAEAKGRKGNKECRVRAAISDETGSQGTLQNSAVARDLIASALLHVCFLPWPSACMLQEGERLRQACCCLYVRKGRSRQDIHEQLAEGNPLDSGKVPLPLGTCFRRLA